MRTKANQQNPQVRQPDSDDEEGWSYALSKGMRRRLKNQGYSIHNPPSIAVPVQSKNPSTSVREKLKIISLPELSPIALRHKFEANLAGFKRASCRGPGLVGSVLNQLRSRFGVNRSKYTGPPHVLLCLGIGNPAAEPASLCQLAFLAALVETSGGLFSPSTTYLYDPLLKAISRDFIRSLGYQILSSNRKGCYRLPRDGASLVFLPHCPITLAEGLLASNWDRETLNRLTFLSCPLRPRSYRSTLASMPCLTRLQPHRVSCKPPTLLDEQFFESLRLEWFSIPEGEVLEPLPKEELPSGGGRGGGGGGEILIYEEISAFVDGVDAKTTEKIITSDAGGSSGESSSSSIPPTSKRAKMEKEGNSVSSVSGDQQPGKASEEKERAECECCCYCSWQSVAPEPVVLVACGSFNPITTMHLRMMELARDAVEKTWSFHNQRKPSDASEDSTPSSQVKKQPSVLNARRQVVVVGLFSPVSGGYQKPGLAPAASRCRLARLACATTSDWLAVDSWEAAQPQWTPTRQVLARIQQRVQRISDRLDREAAQKRVEGEEHKPVGDDDGEMEDVRFGEVINSRPEGADILSSSSETVHRGYATNAWLAAHLRAVREAEATRAESGQLCNCGQKQRAVAESAAATESAGIATLLPVRVKLVCGADLFESFATPGLWADEDITALVRDHGVICISRPGSNAAKLLYELDLLARYEQNVILATEWCQNGLSATVVRRALARGQSVRYLVPDAALEEIYARGLYGATRPSRPSSSARRPLLIFVPPPAVAGSGAPTEAVAPPSPPLPTPQMLSEIDEAAGAKHAVEEHPSTCKESRTMMTTTTTTTVNAQRWN